jgi:hypothetical protein
MLTRLATLLVMGLALLAAGCGGGSSAEDVVRDHLAAIVDQDGAQACDLLTDDLRRDIERAPAALPAGRSCADVMTLAAGLNPGLTAEDVDDLAIEVEESGDEAVASLENPLSRRSETVDLVKVDGDWRIATLETRPRG